LEVLDKEGIVVENSHWCQSSGSGCGCGCPQLVVAVYCFWFVAVRSFVVFVLFVAFVVLICSCPMKYFDKPIPVHVHNNNKQINKHQQKIKNKQMIPFNVRDSNKFEWT
jgi:hypothetical protein